MTDGSDVITQERCYQCITAQRRQIKHNYTMKIAQI